MKFMTTWTLPTGEHYRAAVQHFLKTGGPPPAGVKMLGRWHGADGRGVLIAEGTDEKAIGKWVSEWREFMDIHTTVALDDADMAPILQSLFG